MRSHYNSHLIYFLIIPIMFILCLVDHNVVDAAYETTKVFPLLVFASCISFVLYEVFFIRQKITKIWMKCRGHIQAYTYLLFVTWFSFFSNESQLYAQTNNIVERLFMVFCYVVFITVLSYAFWKEFKSGVDFLSRIADKMNKDFIAPIGFAFVYAYLIKDKIMDADAKDPILSIILSSLIVGSVTYVYQFVIRSVFSLVIDGLRDYYVKPLTKGKDEK